MPKVMGLIVTGELNCGECGRVMRHPERYGYIYEEGKPPRRLCEDCSRAQGCLRWIKDEKGQDRETFL